MTTAEPPVAAKAFSIQNSLYTKIGFHGIVGPGGEAISVIRVFCGS